MEKQSLSRIEKYEQSSARHLILRELARQTDYRTHNYILERLFDQFGYRKDSDWVTDRLLELCREGLVRVEMERDIVTATLSALGRRTIDLRPAWSLI